MADIGDPTDAASRRAALVDAAERVFLKRGYHAARMDEVAEAARMSKRTLYKLVESKEELFLAILARRRPPPDIAVEVEGRPPADVLFEILARWSRHVLAPEAVSLLRLIVAEHLHGRSLSRLLERQSAKPCCDILSDYLAHCAARGELAIEAPEEAAQMLFGMAIGGLHLGMLIGLREKPPEAELDERLRRAVALFLGGAQAQPSVPGSDGLKAPKRLNNAGPGGGKGPSSARPNRSSQASAAGRRLG